MVTGHILHRPRQVLAGHQDLTKSMVLGYLSPTQITGFRVPGWHRMSQTASWRSTVHTKLNHNNPRSSHQSGSMCHVPGTALCFSRVPSWNTHHNPLGE